MMTYTHKFGPDTKTKVALKYVAFFEEEIFTLFTDLSFSLDFGKKNSEDVSLSVVCGIYSLYMIH